mmetsp:Transcript_10897/g.33407  ORF Transcript_10897/g.33407 Transcript_10897/m.33407 type:complete len:406 (+) Transcript_10897:126-1343(+)
MLVDVAVIGATGYTGQLVLRHLAGSTRKDGSQLKVAACGRNPKKLADAVKGVNAKGPTRADVSQVLVDTGDRERLKEVVGNAKVVISCAGPFIKHGLPVVEACAEKGSHYVDITGEVHFVKEAIDLYDGRAVQSGACLVPFAGFDSVPSDLGAYFAVQKAREICGAPANKVHMFCLDMQSSGRSYSSGTMRTILLLLETGAALDHFEINPTSSQKPPGSTPTKFERDLFGIQYDRDAGLWCAPFVMASANTRVVRRSAELLRLQNRPDRYGDNFAYCETTGQHSFLSALKNVLLLASLLLFAVPFFRRMFEKSLGDGQGPDTAAGGSFVFGAVAGTETGRSVQVKLEGPSPYDATGITAAETALYLLEPDAPLPHGVQTPTSASAPHIIGRLEKHGFKFSVVDRL